MSTSKNPMPKQCSFSADTTVLTDSSAMKIKHHIHNLFEAIDKEIDALMNENILLKERVETLEDIIENSGHAIQSDNVKNLPPQKSQQFSVSSVKRDSMVAASHLSQKIKSTYKLKTSSKIFKGQNNSTCNLIFTYDDWHSDGIWYITSSQKNGRQYFATASADSTVNICDAKLDNPLLPNIIYTGHQSSVNCVKFHNNKDLMLTASGDGTAHIWPFNVDNIRNDYDDEQSNEETTIIKSPLLELDHQSILVSCDWMSGVDQCVIASWDSMASIYDYHNGELVVQLVGHDQPLTDVCSHESTRLIVTASHDTTFRLWDFRDAIHSVSVFQGHSRSVTSTCFLGTDKIISGGDDRNVKVWDLKNMRSPLITISMESGINKLSVSQQHNLITIPLDNRNVRIYDINGNRICRLSRNSHNRMVTCATWLNQMSDNQTSSAERSTTNNIVNIPSISLNNNTVTGSNSLTLLTCAFDRRVCGWNIVIEK